MKKRRRVTFAEDVVEHEEARKPERKEKASADDAEVDVTKASEVGEESLLADGGAGNEGITAFDVSAELEDGGRLDEVNGVIPASLQKSVEDVGDEALSSDSEQENDAGGTVDEADAWLDGMGEAPVDAAAEIPAVSKRRRRGGATAAPSTAAPVPSVGACVLKLVGLLRHGESGAGALRRLKSEGARSALDAVTDACHNLLGHGVLGAYDAPREELVDVTVWDLCWDDPKKDGEVHEALEPAAMKGWASAGYFTQRAGFVRPARTGGDANSWLKADDVFPA